MMKHIKMISRIVPALALLVATIATTTLHADTLDRVDTRVVASGAEGGPTVSVLNNHDRLVRVYVVDSDNRLHLLGRVGRSRFKSLQIPAGLVRGTGTVQLKVYPGVLPNYRSSLSLGLFAVNQFEPAGIKTRVLSVQSDQVIVLHLEPNLACSKVGIVSS